MSDPGAAAAALVRAREADDRLSASGQDDPRYRQARDRAVAEALTAGMSPEQLADELGVRIADVERMAAAAGEGSGA
jgi:hypothetical protein